MNHYDLAGNLVIVTGGAQGLGRAIANRLVLSGASVAIWDRDGELAQRTAGELADLAVAESVDSAHAPHVDALELDVTDAHAVSTAVDKLVARRGPVHALVANAGISGPNAPVIDYPVEDWRSVIDVNLHGTFNCCRAVLAHMSRTGYGRIVNVASIAGKEGNPNAGAYSASKAAIIALTKTLGKEHAAADIAVNCVTPAAARTRIFDQMSEEHVDYMLSKIPRGRFLALEEAASMITWLCTSENSFTTGAVFDLSGGRATY